MPIRERQAKKGKTKSKTFKDENGNASYIVYEVYFNYHDSTGATRRYSKSGFKSKKEAEYHEVEMKSLMHKQGDLFIPSNKTLNDVYEEYREVIAEVKLAKSTCKYYKNTYKNHIRKQLGERKINSFRYKDLQSFLNKIKTHGTAENVYKILQNIFKYAIRNEYIITNPLAYTTLEQEKSNSVEINTEAISHLNKQVIDEIVNALFLNLNLVHCPYRDDVIFTTKSYAIAVMIGYYTGLRLSEVFGLEKSDFDFEGNTFKVQRRLEYHGLKKSELHTVERLKNKQSKAELPIATPLKELLLWWFEANPYENVISTIDGNYPLPGTLENRLDRISKELGVEFHFHLLRHLFVTELSRNKVEPLVAKRLARHSKISTTMDIYAHTQLIEEMEAIEDTFNHNRKEDTNDN